MTFKEAVESTPDVRNCYKPGLQAFGSNSRKIIVEQTSKCEGSVDIDSCTITNYPQSSRWDYCLSYSGEVFFVEIHPANTSDVAFVLKKLQWLKGWLNSEAPELNKLRSKSRNPFYWVQSSNFNIPKTSKQYRQVVQEGIKPISSLRLS